MLGTTATPMATLISSKINKVHKLAKPDDYVSIIDSRIVWKDVPKLKHGSDEEYDEINKILDYNLLDDKVSIVLLLSTVRIKEQFELITNILLKRDEWVGLAFNQTGITLKIKNKEIIDTIEFPSISAAFNYVIDELGHKKIIIAAGNKANRGISFVDDKYRYHLTDLYIRQHKSNLGHCEKSEKELRFIIESIQNILM